MTINWQRAHGPTPSAHLSVGPDVVIIKSGPTITHGWPQESEQPNPATPLMMNMDSPVNAQISAVFYNPLFSADHRRPRKIRPQNSRIITHFNRFIRHLIGKLAQFDIALTFNPHAFCSMCTSTCTIL